MGTQDIGSWVGQQKPLALTPRGQSQSRHDLPGSLPMLELANCTYVFDTNLIFVLCRLTLLTFAMCFNDESYHWLNTVRESISFSCRYVVGHENSS